MIGSGPLEPPSARRIMAARLGRLGPGDRAELLRLNESLGDPSALPSPAEMGRFGELIARADAVDPTAWEPAEFAPQPEINRRVWAEAAALQEAGCFVEQARPVACPVTVIHGASDPHPVRGVTRPPAEAGLSVHVFVLPVCGHTPWRERQARDRFFALLGHEVEQAQA